MAKKKIHQLDLFGNPINSYEESCLMEQILKLANLAIKGKDNIKKGAVGFGGYGFVFRDEDFFKSLSEEIFSYGSFIEVGVSHCEDKEIKEGKFHLDRLEYYYLINALMIGSLRTLLPSLKFMDPRESDTLFEAWVIIKTPRGELFPVIYHYDKNRMALGNLSLKGEQIFSKKYPLIYNFKPKELSREERYDLAEAFHNALRKVPLTDYRTIYPGRDYRWHIEVNKGVPLFEQANWDGDESHLIISRRKKTMWKFKWGR